MSMNPIDIGSFWLPKQSSTIAQEIDWAWDVVYWISVAFFVLIVGMMVVFAAKYRRRKKGEKTSDIAHNTTLEVAWTVVPLVLLIGLFAVGLKGYANASVAPAEAYEIKVTGEKWLWTFTYPDGTVTVNEFAIPKDRPVRLLMSSKDVVHSFYIPEFRVKQDVIPGLYTTLWFQATEAKETTLLCTEYCGTGHSDMLAKVMIMEPPKFQEWLEGGGSLEKNVPPAELGKRLFAQRGCATCHSLDGTRIQGPTLKGLFGRTEEIEGGGTVKADENYFKESVLNPNAKIVRGYPPVMPVFQGLLKDKDIDALIAYLKTVQ